MPTRQTREAIEAELNASEIDRIKMQFLGVLRDIEEMEAELQQLATERGLPEFDQSKPLPERMAALGMNQGAIDRIQKYLNALVILNAGGRVDELRADIRRELALRTDAELTGAELLAGIVQNQRKV